MASKTVKSLPLVAAVSATARVGVDDWYCSWRIDLFRYEKSIHILMWSMSFFGVTTIGAHHSVASVTGTIIF